MREEQKLTVLHQCLQGRALLEEEIKWALQHQESIKSRFEEQEIESLLAKLVRSGKAECKPGIGVGSNAGLNAVANGKGEESSFSFSFSKLFRLFQNKKESRAPAYFCNRCGASGRDIHVIYCHRCGGECGYCRRCLTMGRSSCCAKYYLFPYEAQAIQEKRVRVEDALALYPQLTDAQRAAASSMLEFYGREVLHARRDFLVWAVCGAGKTELMFPLLRYLLANGRSALWATPRRDVVLELAPRLRRAFPEHLLAVLHGSALPQEKWRPARFVLATTHQALRFYRCFDAVIVDEIDAFPYTCDDMLPFAVERARKVQGKTIYLTATPRPDHQRRMRKPGNNKDFLPHVKIPVRYHGHPLPEPEIRRESKLNDRLNAKRPIPTLLFFLEEVRKHDLPAFIFVPAIRQLPVLYEYIVFSDEKWRDKIAAVHASDPEREAKVIALREGRLQILLTTTIMERGVTLSGIQVLVCQANAPVFDEAALIQIAGRAGRSAAAPQGTVIFMAEEVTEAMKAAIRQIREMNRLAREQGYIRKGGIP